MEDVSIVAHSVMRWKGGSGGNLMIGIVIMRIATKTAIRGGKDELESLFVRGIFKHE
jgi:hypothetical protein